MYYRQFGLPHCNPAMKTIPLTTSSIAATARSGKQLKRDQKESTETHFGDSFLALVNRWCPFVFLGSLGVEKFLEIYVQPHIYKTRNIIQLALNIPSVALGSIFKNQNTSDLKLSFPRADVLEKPSLKHPFTPINTA